jgi:hypothetical protein
VRKRRKAERDQEKEEKTRLLIYFWSVFFEFFSFLLENLVTVVPNIYYAKS